MFRIIQDKNTKHRKWDERFIEKQPHPCTTYKFLYDILNANNLSLALRFIRLHCILTLTYTFVFHTIDKRMPMTPSNILTIIGCWYFLVDYCFIITLWTFIIQFKFELQQAHNCVSNWNVMWKKNVIKLKLNLNILGPIRYLMSELLDRLQSWLSNFSRFSKWK